MNIRTIPKTIPALVTACARALSGAQRLGDTLGVAQNTAAKIATDYHDFVGIPGSTTELGKRGVLNDRRDAEKTARAARRAVRAAGREFCADGIDHLKPHLGRTWNAAWTAAGFTTGSIKAPRVSPLSMLLELREYLRANPLREIASESFTAAQADALATAVAAAESALDSAVTARQLAAKQSDAAFRRLSRRLGGLREELNRLLEPTDVRWNEFGFARPVDRKRPELVSGLTATPGLPGTVLVQWGHTPRATNFRVSWKVQDASGDPTVAGLYVDHEATLSDLPSGATIEVYLTARNDAGETQPTKAVIVVP